MSTPTEPLPPQYSAYQQPAPTYAPPHNPLSQGPVAPKGLAIAALITGIVAFLMGLLPVIGALVGVAAIVLGAIALTRKQPKGFALTGLILGALGLIASIGVSAGLGALSSEVSKQVENTSISQPEAPKAEEPKVARPAPEAEEPVAAEPVPEPEPEPEPEPAMTIGQSNAVRSAQQYLNYTAFSRTGLIDQLVFESFSTEDATFAVDHVSPDWNLQAAKSAQQYLDYTSFSRQSLIDQLIFEGYTPEQAEHGVNAVGY